LQAAATEDNIVISLMQAQSFASGELTPSHFNLIVFPRITTSPPNGKMRDSPADRILAVCRNYSPNLYSDTGFVPRIFHFDIAIAA
jgi:hypothetical protein